MKTVESLFTVKMFQTNTNTKNRTVNLIKNARYL